MASTLKLLIDYPCQVYIDYELKGNAEANKIFKLPLKKGIYILELKSSNYLLYEQEYTMKSNEEEDLLRIGIKEEDRIKAKEQRFWEISTLNVSIKIDEDKGLYDGKGLYFLNNETGEEYIVDFYRNEDPEYYDKYEVYIDFEKKFDACGLMSIEYHAAGCLRYTALVNKLGQVQIDDYSYIEPFVNKYATVARKEREPYLSDDEICDFIVDKWGTILFKDEFNYIGNFEGDLCIVGKRDDRGDCYYGIVDCFGEVFLDCQYDKIDCFNSCRNDNESIKYAICKKAKEGNYKWGFIDNKKNILKDFEYDRITYFNNSYRVFFKENSIGFLDENLNEVQMDYVILKDLDEGLVKKKGKYGIVRFGSENNSLNFDVKIPCIYDDYKEKLLDDVKQYLFLKKQDDESYNCDEYFVSRYGRLETEKGRSFTCQDCVIFNKELIEIKVNGKWGILGKVDCKYDEIWYRGWLGVIWRENGKKNIGIIDDDGLISRQIPEEEIIETCFGIKGVAKFIRTIKECDKQKLYSAHRENIYNLYVLNDCNGRKNRRIDFLFPLDQIDMDDSYTDKKMIRVIQYIDNKMISRVFSLESMSFQEGSEHVIS